VVGLSDPCGVGLSQYENVCGQIVTVPDGAGRNVSVSTVNGGWRNRQGTEMTDPIYCMDGRRTL
jgi:hypothetical protein